MILYTFMGSVAVKGGLLQIKVTLTYIAINHWLNNLTPLMFVTMYRSQRITPTYDPVISSYVRIPRDQKSTALSWPCEVKSEISSTRLFFLLLLDLVKNYFWRNILRGATKCPGFVPFVKPLWESKIYHLHIALMIWI